MDSETPKKYDIIAFNRDGRTEVYARLEPVPAPTALRERVALKVRADALPRGGFGRNAVKDVRSR
jgi:hypothetical protein